jgi:uncharacterized protein (DUF427 family)
MQAKAIKIPGPEHPITISPSPGRIKASVAGHVIADSSNVLDLKEASYPVVHYIPRKDVDMSQLTRSEHTTYCPYKGDCSYYDIAAAGPRGRNAVWSYEAPHDAVAAIGSYLAFYPDRVDIEVSES